LPRRVPPPSDPPYRSNQLRESARRTADDAEFKDAMAKVETPIAYLDAPEFKTFLDRDAQRLRAAVERIGKVPEN
jgi:tripartite-type tricarboxylate transporter receptor subunit TctC